jgi:hypothetical protein
MATGARGNQREHRIAGSIPLLNVRRRFPAAAFANKTDFPNHGEQGDNKVAFPLRLAHLRIARRDVQGYC